MIDPFFYRWSKYALFIVTQIDFRYNFDQPSRFPSSKFRKFLPCPHITFPFRISWHTHSPNFHHTSGLQLINPHFINNHKLLLMFPSPRRHCYDLPLVPLPPRITNYLIYSVAEGQVKKYFREQGSFVRWHPLWTLNQVASALIGFFE